MATSDQTSVFRNVLWKEDALESRNIIYLETFQLWPTFYVSAFFPLCLLARSLLICQRVFPLCHGHAFIALCII